MMHLKAARVNAGMTQAEVLQKIYHDTGIRIAVSTLSRWEQEKTFPTVPMFQELCQIYGVRMDDILIPEPA